MEIGGKTMALSKLLHHYTITIEGAVKKMMRWQATIITIP